MWFPLQVAVFAVLTHVYAFSGADFERVHRRVWVGPRSVDPSPGVKNAPLLRPVAVGSRFGSRWACPAGCVWGAAGECHRAGGVVMASTGFRWPDVGRVAGVKLASGEAG